MRRRRKKYHAHPLPLRTRPRPNTEKLAWILLTLTPPEAPDEELIRTACRRWDDLRDDYVGSIVIRAREIREERWTSG